MLQRCCQARHRCYARAFRVRSRREYSRGAFTSGIRPLRVLYCGSDDFSASILHRLHEEHQKDHEFISSIDVVTKENKPTGRGLKTIVQGPCQRMARELDLSVHEIPTFSGWTPPPVDIVLAVSFGLLVPPRILSGATHGGLNLHPSLLPDLWGPAPLHHTLLQGRKSSGITLQTLHPRHFDKGQIVSSTAFDLPSNGHITLPELRDFTAKLGADLLIRSLREGLYLRKSLDEIQPTQAEPRNLTSTHAYKLTKEDAHVDWNVWPSDRIVRTCSVLGNLWSYGLVHRKGKVLTQRIRWSGISFAAPGPLELHNRMQVGKVYGVPTLDSMHRLTAVKAADGRVVTIEKTLPEGCSPDILDDSAARMVGREDL